jgi:predicted DNA-binding protein YlxM (UPF0122 family)
LRQFVKTIVNETENIERMIIEDQIRRLEYTLSKFEMTMLEDEGIQQKEKLKKLKRKIKIWRLQKQVE